MKNYIYENITNDISKILKYYLLNEKYGSLTDNQEIFTPELFDIIKEIEDLINTLKKFKKQNLYLYWTSKDEIFKKNNWEETEENTNYYVKQYDLQNTYWIESFYIVINKKIGDIDISTHGRFWVPKQFKQYYAENKKYKFVIELNSANNIKDTFLHELKHAYDQYIRFKNNRERNNKTKALYNKCKSSDQLINPANGDKFLDIIYQYQDINSLNNEDMVQFIKYFLMSLQYLCFNSEKYAFAENIQTEIKRYFTKNIFSIISEDFFNIKNYSLKFYPKCSKIICYNKIFNIIDKNYKTNNKIKTIVDDVCKDVFNKSYNKVKVIFLKSLKKYNELIRKNIVLYKKSDNFTLTRDKFIDIIYMCKDINHFEIYNSSKPKLDKSLLLYYIGNSKKPYDYIILDLSNKDFLNIYTKNLADYKDNNRIYTISSDIFEKNENGYKYTFQNFKKLINLILQKDDLTTKLSLQLPYDLNTLDVDKNKISM